jgi:hypothetical protein
LSLSSSYTHSTSSISITIHPLLTSFSVSSSSLCLFIPSVLLFLHPSQCADLDNCAFGVRKEYARLHTHIQPLCVLYMGLEDTCDTLHLWVPPYLPDPLCNHLNTLSCL